MSIINAFAEYDLAGLLTTNPASAIRASDYLCGYQPGKTTLLQALSVIPHNYVDVMIQHQAHAPVVLLTPDRTLPISVLFPGESDTHPSPEGQRLGLDGRLISELVSANRLCKWIILVVTHWVQSNRTTWPLAIRTLQTFALSDINECNPQTIFLLATITLLGERVDCVGYAGEWGVIVHLLSSNGLGRLCTRVAATLTPDERNNWIKIAIHLHATGPYDDKSRLSDLLSLAAYEVGLPAERAATVPEQLLVLVYLVATVEGQLQVEVWQNLTPFEALPAPFTALFTAYAACRPPRLPLA